MVSFGVRDPDPIIAVQVSCPKCSAANQLNLALDRPQTCHQCSAHLPWVSSADDDRLAAMLALPMHLLVEFSSARCAPCAFQKPVLVRCCAAVANTHPGKLRLIEADTGLCPQAATQWRIASVPVTFLVRGGSQPSLLARWDGLTNAAVINQALATALE